MLTILTPAASQDLVTVERVKNELSLTGSEVDSTIQDLIAEASAIIAGYCGREGFGQEYVRQTERLSCGREFIVLERNLAAEVLLATEAGTELTADEYEVDGALLYRLEDDERVCWTAGKIVIDYTAGYDLTDEAPVALSRAALDLVVGMYRGIGRDTAIRSEQVEGIGQTAYFDWRGGTLPLSADRVAALARYRLVSIG
jgi:hypothetical protein